LLKKVFGKCLILFYPSKKTKDFDTYLRHLGFSFIGSTFKRICSPHFCPVSNLKETKNKRKLLRPRDNPIKNFRLTKTKLVWWIVFYFPLDIIVHWFNLNWYTVPWLIQDLFRFYERQQQSYQIDSKWKTRKKEVTKEREEVVPSLSKTITNTHTLSHVFIVMFQDPLLIVLSRLDWLAICCHISLSLFIRMDSKTTSLDVKFLLKRFDKPYLDLALTFKPLFSNLQSVSPI
jgi:hypothetical protein